MTIELSNSVTEPSTVPASFTGSGAEILLEALVASGVRMIFGLPGDTGIALYDALAGYQDRLRHVLARDERHAGVMADVFARCRNEVAVLEVSSGAGMTYAIGGLGEAYAASLPLLLIASDIHQRSRNTGAITEIDSMKLFSAVTKWAALAQSAAELPKLVRMALTQATSGCPGPVALVIPVDVLEEQLSTTIVPGSISAPRSRSAASPGAVELAARALDAAKRPAVLAGSGVHLSGAWDALAQLAGNGGIPVATSIHGKGAISETSTWSLGVAGANGARPYANKYLATADAVLLVGTRANSTDTSGYTAPARIGTTVMQIDIEADRVGRNYPGCIELVGDARETLAALAGSVHGDPSRSAELRAWIAKERREWQESLPNALDVDVPPNGPLSPYAVFAALRAATPVEATVISDCGTPTPYLAQLWEIEHPGRDVISARGHGAMGYALPGAVGAALARPGRPVLALTTDGSFPMCCGELETIARYQLPITIVEFANGSFCWIKMHQHLYHDKRYFGVDHGRVDGAAAAIAFGIAGRKVASPAALESAVREAFQLGRPTLIEVEVADELAIVPPVAPWVAAVAAGGGKPPVY
jgi:acetolactate synthase-1/2/3 large subunit